MFKHLSRQLTGWLIEKKAVDFEDKEIYQYGISRFFSILLVYTTTFVLGLTFNQFYQSIIFIISLLVLRSFSGGYHASSSINCYLLSILAVVSFLLVNKFVFFSRFVWMGLLVMFGIIIILLSPVGTSNKPLDDIEKILYKKKTIIVWCLESLVALIFLFWNFGNVYIPIVFSHFVVSIALISERIKH